MISSKLVWVVAFLVAVMGVVLLRAAEVRASEHGVLYVWQHYDREGLPDGDPVLAEENPFGECDGLSADVCVSGTPEGETIPVLFYYYH